ncbi:hypothetical protein LJR219_000958 [Phenylobacterium sp. LjRoot219]|uniref:hypothetical protein n=1 Tax=Phenylobacterium sp. LjRoot219 TaxID=3342283 RepID=UPI003ECEB4B5
MSRHSFRSQPTLRRSGGWRPPSSLLGLAGLVALGLSFGAIVSHIQESPITSGQAYGVADSDLGGAAARVEAEAQAAAAAPPLLVLPAPQLIQASAPVAAKTPKPRAPRAAKPPRTEAAAAPTPQQAWEQQRQDYERAVETYEANERAEGRRWAQANRIRLARYCRAAAGRTPAFLQGCLSHARAEGGGAAERAGAGAERAGEPG